MFASLYSLSTPLASLLEVAEDFTPRFEVIGPLVMLDVSGLARLFGGPREIGEQLRRSAGAPVRVSLAPSQTAAALLALGRPGLTVVLPGEQAAALAPLQVGLLGELERIKNDGRAATETQRHRTTEMGDRVIEDRVIEELGDLKSNRVPIAQPSQSANRQSPNHPTPQSNHPIPQSPTHSLGRCGGGWSHPREAHAARHMRRARRAPQAAGVEHAHAAADTQHSALGTQHAALGMQHSALGTTHAARSSQHPHAARSTQHAALKDIQSLLDTLRRWGIKTLGVLAALPPGEVYERLGGRGVMWQRLARGDDPGPLVPWVLEDPFEAMLELEWPIEGLEPLSFVLARLFEPLAERLERADRGAAILHTHLHLVTREIHARTVQLPAPMRDPKTLRTLVLLDLESSPPSAAVDRVRVLVEPTPARVLQWALFERAQPSPEQVSTLLARLLALMGEGHVGSPQLVDSWKPGAFEIKTFQVPGAECQVPSASAECRVPSARAACSVPRALSTQHAALAPSTQHPALAPSTQHPALARSTRHAALGTLIGTALRRFRFPVPARVQMQEGRPVRVMVDRRGLPGGAVRQAAGPWRTSGEWWNDGPVGQVGQSAYPPHPPPLASVPSELRRTSQTQPPYQPHTAWDRDEWDVALADGTLYRIFVERDVGQWFIEGVVD